MITEEKKVFTPIGVSLYEIVDSALKVTETPEGTKELVFEVAFDTESHEILDIRQNIVYQVFLSKVKELVKKQIKDEIFSTLEEICEDWIPTESNLYKYLADKLKKYLRSNQDGLGIEV